jgi:hypothetical protein
MTEMRVGARARLDDVYAKLLAAHRDLDEPTSALLNARLVLLLAQQVGDTETVMQAIETARRGLAPAGDEAKGST